MNSEKAKTLVREVLPPALMRLIPPRKRRPRSAPRTPKRAIQEGREREPEWYDKSFLAHEHWRMHYTKSPYYPLWAVISDRVARAGVESVLDIGCGPGQLASLLRDRGLPGYVGIDFSPERVAWAKQVCPEREFVVGDAFETSLFDEHDYDAVVTTEFLEHVEGDLRIIEKIRPGARLYASVPNFPSAAHVRYFESEQEIYDRYIDYFDYLSVDVFPSNDKGRVFYLIEGMRG